MIINHVYLNNNKCYASEHFELLLINNYIFDYEKINENKLNNNDNKNSSPIK